MKFLEFNKRIMVLSILTIINIFLFDCRAQSKDFNKLVSKIEKQKFLFKNHILTRTSLKYVNKLNKIATEKELLDLSTMDCKLCFSYSFWVLSKQNQKIADCIYQDYRKDDISEYKYIELNEYQNRKNCVKFLYSEFQFINEIKNKKKYLDIIQ